MKNLTFFKLQILFLGLLFLSLSSTQHEYYVSVTKVEYVKEQQSLQITSQIFIDDFERLLQKHYDANVILSDSEDADTVNAYMEKYLKAKLQLTVNGVATDLQFLGKTYKNDIVYCYIEVENVSEITRMEITNTILFDLYESQQNIVRTTIADSKKGFVLTKGKPMGSVKL